MDFSIEKCDVYHDARGNLVQFVSEKFLAQLGLGFGQIYLLTFDGKETVRGNHYHFHSSEMFCLIQGEIELVLEDVKSKERFSQVFSSSNDFFYRIHIGPQIAHAIKSLSESAVLVSYASRMYNPLDEDKFVYKLL